MKHFGSVLASRLLWWPLRVPCLVSFARPGRDTDAVLFWFGELNFDGVRFREGLR